MKEMLLYWCLIVYSCTPHPLLFHVDNWRYSHILLGAGNLSPTEEIAFGVCNQVSPYLCTVNISSAVVCCSVALYCQTVTEWCLFYFVKVWGLQLSQQLILRLSSFRMWHRVVWYTFIVFWRRVLTLTFQIQSCLNFVHLFASRHKLNWRKWLILSSLCTSNWFTWSLKIQTPPHRSPLELVY